MNSGIPQELQDRLDEIDRLVQSYFKEWWKTQGVLEDGDYISGWALVANFGNIGDSVPSGYVVESSPVMAPHVLKGLFAEAIDWVVEKQAEDNDDE